MLIVYASNFDVGNQCITPAIIYRGLTGKITKGGKGKITIDQREIILNSVTKLMNTLIDIDETETNAMLNYGENRSPIIFSAILPAYFKKETTINGQDASVIYFDRESPLMTIARDRKQVISYDNKLLDAPGVNNTWLNIVLINYGIKRVMEIKRHKQLKHIIMKTPAAIAR